MSASAVNELPREVVVTGDASGFEQRIGVGVHELRSDEPKGVGGTDTGLTPYDLLLAALGSCTSMTLGLYAATRSTPFPDWKRAADRFGVTPESVEDHVRQMA